MDRCGRSVFVCPTTLESGKGRLKSRRYLSHHEMGTKLWLQRCLDDRNNDNLWLARHPVNWNCGISVLQWRPASFCLSNCCFTRWKKTLTYRQVTWSIWSQFLHTLSMSYTVSVTFISVQPAKWTLTPSTWSAHLQFKISINQYFISMAHLKMTVSIKVRHTR